MEGLLATEFGNHDAAVEKYILLLNHGDILKPRIYKEALFLLREQFPLSSYYHMNHHILRQVAV